MERGIHERTGTVRPGTVRRGYAVTAAVRLPVTAAPLCVGSACLRRHAAAALWALVFAALAGLGGCSSAQKGAAAPAIACHGDHAAACGPQMSDAEEASRSLLFLPVVGITPVAPERFARDDWPVTPGRQMLAETVYYREIWYDWQHLGPHGRDHGYRFFSYGRGGVQVGR